MMTTLKGEANSSHPVMVEKVLEQMERLWNQTTGKPDGKILRIALMRELSRSLHTLRSECLALGEDGQAQDILRREEFLSQRFMEIPAQNLPLRQVYARSAAGRAEKRTPEAPPELPAELTAVLDESKLTRPDRRWEAFLAYEAFTRKWTFWTFECWVEVEKVESFAREISDALWPRGVVLFIESSGFHRGEPALWRGKWYLIIEPAAVPATGNPDLAATLGISVKNAPRVAEETEERQGPHWSRLR